MDNHMFMGMQPDEADMLSAASSLGMQPNNDAMMVTMPIQQKKPSQKRPSKKSSSSNKVKDEDGTEEGDIPPAKKSASKSKSGSSKKKKTPQMKQSSAQLVAGTDNASGSGSQFGRWKPEDDYALITAVQQTCDLTSVYLGIRFSSKFSLREIQERWYTLLYDPIVSTLAKSAIQNLPIEVVCRIERETLFSRAEEAVLCTVPSNNQMAPSAEVFDQLLHSHSSIFHPSRSPYMLLRHWQRLHRYHMLTEQQNMPNHEFDLPDPLSDVEDEMVATSSQAGAAGGAPKTDESGIPFMPYTAVAMNQQRKQIRKLENESAMLNAIAEPIVGISPTDFHQPQTLAVLRGRAVRYLMRSPEITVGRNPPSSSSPLVNVDVSLEGPAWRVSRRQAVITMKPVGEFYIENIGRTSFVVDSKPVLPQSGQVRLQNNSTLEIGGCLHFLFLINPDLANQQQQQQPVPAATSSQQPQQQQQQQNANVGQNQPQQPQNAAHSSTTPPTQMTNLPPTMENNNAQYSAGAVGVVMQNQQQQAYAIGGAPPQNANNLVSPNVTSSAMPPNMNQPGVAQFQPRPVYMQQPGPPNPPQQQVMPPGHPQYSPQGQYPPHGLPVQHHFASPVGSPPMMPPNSSPHYISGYRLVNPNANPQQPQQYQQQQQQHPRFA